VYITLALSLLTGLPVLIGALGMYEASTHCNVLRTAMMFVFGQAAVALSVTIIAFLQVPVIGERVDYYIPARIHLAMKCIAGMCLSIT